MRYYFITFDEIVSPIALETTFRISNEGQIPFENRTLNSLTSPIGGQSIVRPSEIRTRTTGDIALEDGLGHNLVLKWNRWFINQRWRQYGFRGCNWYNNINYLYK